MPAATTMVAPGGALRMALMILPLGRTGVGVAMFVGVGMTFPVATRVGVLAAGIVRVAPLGLPPPPPPPHAWRPSASRQLTRMVVCVRRRAVAIIWHQELRGFSTVQHLPT